MPLIASRRGIEIASPLQETTHTLVAAISFFLLSTCFRDGEEYIAKLIETAGRDKVVSDTPQGVCVNSLVALEDDDDDEV